MIIGKKFEASPIISGFDVRTLMVHHLFVHGYHWLPIATIDLVGDNREFEV